MIERQAERSGVHNEELGFGGGCSNGAGKRLNLRQRGA